MLAAVAATRLVHLRVALAARCRKRKGTSPTSGTKPPQHWAGQVEPLLKKYIRHLFSRSPEDALAGIRVARLDLCHQYKTLRAAKEIPDAASASDASQKLDAIANVC